MGMADDNTVFEGLRSSIVGRISIGKRTSHEVGHLDADIEGGVGFDGGAAVQRKGNNGRDHLGLGWDVTHGCNDQRCLCNGRQ